MSKEKHIPERKCIGCQGRFPKSELIRVVRSPEGEVALDFVGKKAGRGAYLCRDVKCLRRARKSGRIGRVLECEIPEAVYDAMEAELEAHGNDER